MPVKSPQDITAATVDIGVRKVSLASSMPRLLLLSVLAGAYIALGGALSVIAGFGFPEITASNPSMQRLLSGSVFPVGLILVVVLGAELFTGNNAMLIPAFMQRRYGAMDVIRNWTVVYIGNFIGSLLFAWLLVYCTGMMDAEPYSGAITGIARTKTSLPWMVVLTRGIGANWCVCLALWLALAGKGLLEKMAGCWFPVMAFVALGYEHSVANMFFIPMGMMLGSGTGMYPFLVGNLLPATIGNIIGGALFVGCAHGWLYLKKE
ncbi:MAG: formate/nitrite transporter family protein [Muribaculaceae bacterium]|nr:formate/nitrite transporter family protein [Muribaculaceae bacterium]